MSADGQVSEVAFEEQPETARGRAIYRTLLYVHSHIRGDLQIVQQLATRAIDGVSGAELEAELFELKRSSILWQLQVNCLRYCSFVHAHHGAEDADFFGELRETNPAVGPVIDRLQAEHRRVSDDLDAVEAAAYTLARDESRPAREAVVEALGALERNLLAHLDYEELSVAGTARRLREFG